MTRVLVVLMAAGLLLASGAQAKGPHAILTPGPDAPEAGDRPWKATLELMELGGASKAALLARRGHREARATLRPAATEFDDVRRHDAELAFPSEGRWELVALSGKRRFDLGAVNVGGGRVPPVYAAFAAGSRHAAPGSGGESLPPEEFTVAAETPDDGGVPLWLLPVAGVVLAGAGLLRIRLR